METTEKRMTFSEIIRGEKPVLVDFHATWCGPCKMLAPVLQKMAGKYSDNLKIIKIDVDKNQAAAQAYKVRGVPTMILFKDGKQVWQQSGYMTMAQLEQQIGHFIN